jgi:rod shape-determining protein MreD
MGIDLFKRILFFAILLVAQALVLNHVHLFDCAIPLLYVYLVLLFPRNFPKWAILLWSFALGLGVDTFTNTPGLAAASMTLLGAIQPYMFEAFVPRDSAEDLEPGMRSLGFSSFALYALALVFIYCLAYFSLEAFNFFNWQQWLLCIGCSTALTLLLILVIENIRKG